MIMHYYNDDDSDKYNNTAQQVLDRLFSSPEWNSITEHADEDDLDSLELMEQVSCQLNSLVWHLKNDSGDQRILYELSYFTQLIDDLEIV